LKFDFEKAGFPPFQGSLARSAPALSKPRTAKPLSLSAEHKGVMGLSPVDKPSVTIQKGQSKTGISSIENAERLTTLLPIQ
jgi:hypothetical protein